MAVVVTGSGYVLGVDLGTTFTAAAIVRDGRPEVVSLGGKSTVIPSVVLLREDGELLTGTAAERRGVTEPSRLAREFKRRFGDRTPLLLAGTPLLPEELTAVLLRAVVDLVVQREGAAPERICLTYPANWGLFKRELLLSAVRRSGIDIPTSLVTEPTAAAAAYAGEHRVDPGGVVAVYDLGGGTFDAAVLRRGAEPDSFELLGTPRGIEQLGGIDLDAAVFEHVSGSLGARWTELDEDDPATVVAVARLRTECVDAKEALSSDTDVSIPVLLPGYATEVRLTRAELEATARPMLRGTLDTLRSALASAGVEPVDVDSVLLVGGVSRMPLVAELVGAEFGRPVAVDAHPKHAVALGAARIAAATVVESAVAQSAAAHPPIGSRPGRRPRRAVAAATAVPLVAAAVVAAGWWAATRDDAGPVGEVVAAPDTAQQDLRQLVERGDAVVQRDLRGSWVPQLTAESADVADAVVLADHRRLADQVPGALLIRADDYPRVFEPGTGYVTLADVGFGTADEVFGWCAPRVTECVARRLADTGDPAVNTGYPLRAVMAGGVAPGDGTTGDVARTDRPVVPPIDAARTIPSVPDRTGADAGPVPGIGGPGPVGGAGPDTGVVVPPPTESSVPPPSSAEPTVRPSTEPSPTTPPESSIAEPTPVESSDAAAPTDAVVPADVAHPAEAVRPIEPVLPTTGVARPRPVRPVPPDSPDDRVDQPAGAVP